MATTNEMVEQLSQDLGDYWKSTTTGAGTATTLVDTALINEDDDDFVTDRCQIHMLGGSAADESAGVLSKSGSTLTVKTGADFGAATGNGNDYEVHRLFTRKEKEDAITRALLSVFPRLFTIKKEELTVVANQYTYATTNFSYLRRPSQAFLESNFDAELDHEIFDWEMLPEDDKFRLNHLPAADRIIILRGIVPPALSEITDDRHKLILSAQAALELYDQAIVNSPSDNVSRWERVYQRAQQKLNKRVADYGPIAPPWTIRTTVYNRNLRSTYRRA